MSIADLRQEYPLASLDERDVARDPFTQFGAWFDQAMKAALPEPTAMTLATVTPAGRPSARIVLLKGFDPSGFVFYSNYASRKGQELAGNAHAALLFHWVELERQVRIEGRVEKIAAHESDQYFASRPLASRISACASPQSEVLADRAQLEALWQGAAQRYGDNPPRPAHWGGFRLAPQALEFWQGRRSRLHDRIRYRLELGDWVIERLAP